MNNIILIGMPGAGKSTIGVLLAKIMGFRFLDTDLIIQDKEKRLLREIIEADGIDGFLAIENQICKELDVSNCVIATGGSVIYEEEAMSHLKTMGTVVYLQLNYDDLSHRLGSLKRRGVVLRDGQTLKMLFDERIPLYEKYADITVSCSNQNIELTLDSVVSSVAP